MDANREMAGLIRAFCRTHLTCTKNEFVKQGLGELSNPEILFIIRKSVDKPVTQKRLADMIGVAPPTIAVSIKRMERWGLVERATDQIDQRKNRVTLTDKGRALIQQLEDHEQQVLHNTLQCFSPQEIDQLGHYLIRMIHNMREMGVKMPARLKEDQPETD